MLRHAAPRFIWFLLLAGLAIVLWGRRDDIARISGMASPTSYGAFQAWVREDNARRSEFVALQAYLRSEQVDGIVSAWQLTRIDEHYARRCDLSVFRVPPRELWPNVVEPLRLVRDEVVPAVGEVQVLSSYRTPELNTCARGASHSNHLDFAALDLATATRQGGAEFYQSLCAMQDDAGAASLMGLGAYYDPARPTYAGGRFHIDASGYRSWGSSYTSASSPCR